MAVTFAQARRIVYGAEGVATERTGYEDVTHWLVVRVDGDPDKMITDQLVPLVDKRAGLIEYVVPHLPEVARRFDAMRAVRD